MPNPAPPFHRLVRTMRSRHARHSQEWIRRFEGPIHRDSRRLR